MLLTPKDLSFVGYTYKNFEAVKGLRNSFGMGTFFYFEHKFLLTFSFPFILRIATSSTRYLHFFV